MSISTRATRFLFLLLASLTIAITTTTTLFVAANPTGSATCMENQNDLESFMFHHGSSSLSDTASRLILADLTTEYVAGCTHNLAVCAGAEFKGFLIYTSDANNNRIGDIDASSTTQSVSQYMTCNTGTSKSTLTHNSNTNKPSQLNFQLTTNPTQSGNITINVFLVTSLDQPWIFLSKTLAPQATIDGEITCPQLSVDSLVCPQMGDSPSGEMSMSMRSTYFHNNWQDMFVLFEEWKLGSPVVYAISIIVVFVLATSYEALTALQQSADQSFEKQLRSLLSFASSTPEASSSSSSSSSSETSSVSAAASAPTPLPPHSSQPNPPRTSAEYAKMLSSKYYSSSRSTGIVITSSSSPSSPSAKPIYFSWHQQIFRTFLHIVKSFIVYCLMLIFMSFEVGLCVSMLGGYLIGYLVFSRKRTPKNNSC